MEVQPGNEVTLQCNMNTNVAVIFWFQLVNRTKVSCVSVKIHPSDAQHCEGFRNGRFEMTNNDSTVSLKISSVAKSDAGLYFCGFYTSGNLTFNVVHLDVKGKIFLKFCLVILCHLCLFCISIFFFLQPKNMTIKTLAYVIMM